MGPETLVNHRGGTSRSGGDGHRPSSLASLVLSLWTAMLPLGRIRPCFLTGAAEKMVRIEGLEPPRLVNTST